jgi:hypothetical protein
MIARNTSTAQAACPSWPAFAPCFKPISSSGRTGVLPRSTCRCGPTAPGMPGARKAGSQERAGRGEPMQPGPPLPRVATLRTLREEVNDVFHWTPSNDFLYGVFATISVLVVSSFVHHWRRTGITVSEEVHKAMRQQAAEQNLKQAAEHDAAMRANRAMCAAGSHRFSNPSKKRGTCLIPGCRARESPEAFASREKKNWF